MDGGWEKLGDGWRNGGTLGRESRDVLSLILLILMRNGCDSRGEGRGLHLAVL